MSELSLNGGVEWSATGLQIPEGFSFEQWQELGGILDRVASGWQWWYGDWWVFGERRFGEEHSQALPEKGRQTKANAAWVANQVPVSRRREGLSFSHHAEVAALDAAEQVEWLDTAVRESWTVRELRTAVRTPALPEEGEASRCWVCGSVLKGERT